jgi:site-specific DNA recombinase|tara:strand:+ start:1678 stop:2379 length:702 start_codon:yes stop_codon:yes gene_type:complete
MNKVIGFVRVSTLKQTTSIKNQIDRIKRYCKKNELQLIEVIREEGISGAKKMRKGFSEMLDRVEKKEIDGIVCLNLSRIGRTASQTLELINSCLDSDVFILDIKDGTDTRTAGGRMAVKLRAVIYEEELFTIRENIREVMRYKKANGMKYNGRLAYGVYEKNGVLYEDEYEMKIIRNMKNQRSRGWSWYKIMKKLNENSIPTKENGKKGWTINQVKKVYKYHYDYSEKPMLVK